MYFKQLIIVTFFLIAFSLNAEEYPEAGQIAPNFEITQMDGEKFKLSDYKGKQAVYLVFWNTWCQFCIKKIPTLIKSQNQISDDLKIIAVNTTNKDSYDESIDFIQKYKINYSLAFDYGQYVTDLYNVWGTPTEFIIDINGIVKFRDDIPKNLSKHIKEWNKLSNKIKSKTTTTTP